MRSQGTAEELERRRRLAVRRVAEGWEQKKVAEFLGVTPRTVSRWTAAHRDGGDDALAAKPTRGRPPKLSARCEKSVLARLARSPRAFGYESDLWTTGRLAEVIEKRFKVRFNSNYLAEWLTARGLSPQKPEVRAVERDEPAIARWVEEDWPRIKKAAEERAHLVLIDESGSFLYPVVRRTWAARGRTPVLTGFGRHRDDVSTIAAITVAPRRRRMGLYWRTDPDRYIDAGGVVAFLRELLGRLRGRVIVVWDGGSNHKGPLLRALETRYPGCTLSGSRGTRRTTTRWRCPGAT